MDDDAITADQRAAITELAALFQIPGLDYWLFGGWAVDAHLGRVTRAHGDIDVAVWAADVAAVVALLAGRGWVHRPEEGEDGYTVYERGVVRLEVALLVRDESGHVYTPIRAGRAEWPAGAFGEDVGVVAGTRVRVIARRALLVEKAAARSDPAAAAKDQADVAALADIV